MFISRFIQANYFKKYLAENAVNTISEPLDFKIFCGGMPPDPPTNSRLRRSFSAPPLRNNLRRPCLINMHLYKAPNKTIKKSFILM